MIKWAFLTVTLSFVVVFRPGGVYGVVVVSDGWWWEKRSRTLSIEEGDGIEVVYVDAAKALPEIMSSYAYRSGSV